MELKKGLSPSIPPSVSSYKKLSKLIKYCQGGSRGSRLVKGMLKICFKYTCFKGFKQASGRLQAGFKQASSRLQVSFK